MINIEKNRSNVAGKLLHYQKTNDMLKIPLPTIVTTKLKIATTTEEYCASESNGGMNLVLLCG